MISGTGGEAGVLGWLLLAVGVMAVWAGAVAMSVYERQICRYYGIGRKERPRLKFADASSIDGFDAWLAAHHRSPRCR